MKTAIFHNMLMREWVDLFVKEIYSKTFKEIHLKLETMFTIKL
jgi:hypothetical protein